MIAAARLLLDRVQAVMLRLGCPMAVKHNEAAGQPGIELFQSPKQYD